MAWLGISSLHSISEHSDTMKRSAERALLATRANNNVLTMNGAEFRSALDPRDENRLAARSVIDEQSKQLEERLAEVGKTRDEKTQALLVTVRSAFADYQSQIKQTLQSVDGAKSAELTKSATELRDVAMKSRAAAEKLQIAIRAVANRLDQRVMENNKASEEEYASASRLLLILAIVSVSFGLLFGFVVGQYGIAKPIRAMVELLQQLAGGKYDINISGTDRGDEVGEVANTALVFKENGLARIRMEREQKDAEARSAAQRRTDMLQLADGFERAVGEIVETVSSASTELEASAGTLTATAERAQELDDHGGGGFGRSIHQCAVGGVGDRRAVLLGQRDQPPGAGIGADGDDAVGQARITNDRVGELSKAAARIGDVVELINTIAGQTNLLALNATIEAARAGEAGRGFAVVASEVKALAEQTAKATGEIGQQISSIQAATEESVGAIKDISGTIERLSEISSAIAAAVEEQGAATQEISRNVQQAAQGTQQVSSNITDVQRGASETGSASSQVLSAAQSLSSDSNRLKLEVGKFLDTVRAA